MLIIDLKTPHLHLRSFFESDITDDYIKWLNDPEINRFLESRFQVQDFFTVKEWVHNHNPSKEKMLIGIFKDDIHIGNITFHKIDSVHKFVVIGICIGRKSFQGKGYATEALQAAVRYIFNEMKFNRIEAGIYHGNVTSIKLFRKVGFRQEAIFKKRVIFEGKYIDMLLFACLRSEFCE